jgi:hypothetical protein
MTKNNFRQLFARPLVLVRGTGKLGARQALGRAACPMTGIILSGGTMPY